MTHTSAPFRIAMLTTLRRALATVSIAAVTVTGCTPDQILDVTDPDILNVSDYTTAAGANALRVGALSDFQAAFTGSIDGIIVSTGNMADEIRSTDTFEDRLSVSSRTMIENNPALLGTYRTMHRARSGASQAIRVHRAVAPEPATNIAELYIYRGFLENFFGEMYCSGVPFAVENPDGTLGEGPQLTTTQVFQRALASLDTALTLAGNSATLRPIAQIGRGRVLLNLGQYAQAATAVSGVATAFKWETFHSTNSGRQENQVWGALSVTAPRYTVIDREGTNGLPYLQTPADPRMPWAATTRVGFNSLHTRLPDQRKYTRTSSVTIADGIEARLIELEARLQGGTQADRDAVFAGLNTLRASGRTGVVPPQMTGTAPTTQDAAVNLLFQERAYWMWLTGHRLGDLRRLVRLYRRPVESVYPTGALAQPLVGNYGTDVNFVIPFEERNSSTFKGCLDRNA
jgi:hypothetical protein